MTMLGLKLLMLITMGNYKMQVMVLGHNPERHNPETHNPEGHNPERHNPEDP